MSKITASDVNKLRKSTGAGIMDCKKALVEANGDFDLAIENLRKKGQKVAAKRADRDSSEGAVIAKVNDANTTGIIISLNCETDFVAKNESFVALANQIATIALYVNTKDELMSSDFEDMTVQEKLIEQTGILERNLKLVLLKELVQSLLEATFMLEIKLQLLLDYQILLMGLQKLQKMFLCRLQQ